MNTEEVLRLPEILRSDVRWLWHSDYWDGVLSGMLLYQNKKYWFACFDDSADHAKWDEEKEELEDLGWWRRFAIIEITQEQIDSKEYWHSLFEKYVGVHATYGKNEKRLGEGYPKYMYRGIPCALGMVDPNKYWGLFTKMVENTDMVIESLNLSSGKIIGWFHN